MFNACLVIVMGIFVYLNMLMLCLVETLELFSDVNNEVYHLKPQERHGGQPCLFLLPDLSNQHFKKIDDGEQKSNRTIECFYVSTNCGYDCVQMVVVWDTSRCGRTGEIAVVAKAHTDVDIMRIKIVPFDDTR